MPFHPAVGKTGAINFAMHYEKRYHRAGIAGCSNGRPVQYPAGVSAFDLLPAVRCVKPGAAPTIFSGQAVPQRFHSGKLAVA
jgi:hypothetical protein